MRVASRGNLTVELIRMHRFAVDGPVDAEARELSRRPVDRCEPSVPRCDADKPPACIDRVELGRETLEIDPWSSAYRTSHYPQPAEEPAEREVPIELPPRPITPVVGSPALAGLGVALVVPGTLLDVVA